MTMDYLIKILDRLGFWGFVLTFTLFAVVISELLIMVQSYLLTGHFFDTNLLIAGFFTPLIDGFLLFFITGLLLNKLRQARQQEARLKERFKENSLLLRRVVDQIPDPLVLKNFDGKFILTNEACAKLYNTTVEDMVGKDDGDYIPDKALAEFFRKNVQAIMRKGKTEIVFEDSIDAKTGQYKHYRSIKKPFYNTRGDHEILVLAQDITELKQAQDKLKEKESYQRALLANFPFMVWLKDTDSRFLALNKVMTDTGKITSPEQAIGQSDIDLWGEEMAQDYQAADQMVMQSGQPLEQEERFSVKGKTGWLHTYKAPVVNDEGQLLGTVGFARDITQHKEDLKELFLLQHALKNSKDAYYLVDQNARFVMVNESASIDTGYSVTNLMKMSVADIDHEPPVEDWQTFWQSLKETRSKRLETFHTRQDGSRYPVDIVLSFIEYENEEYILALVRNVEEQKQQEALLKTEQDRFRLAVEGSQDGIWDWSVTTNEVFFSDRYIKMLGYSTDEFSQTFEAWVEKIHPEDLAKVHQDIDAHLSGKTPVYENRHRLLCKDGSWKWFLARGKANFDEEGNTTHFVGFQTDISEEVLHQERLDHIAKHDVLTDLPNRFMLSELLETTMARTKRQQTQLAILYIDLDGFKEINDQYGHNIGDSVLIQVSHRMTGLIRSNDLISRLGGDEFTVVLADLEDKDEAIPMINRFIEHIAQPIHSHDNEGHPLELNITVSIGVTLYPQSIKIGSDALLRQADQAMYLAKTAGKNNYKFFDLNENKAAIEKQTQITQIEQAIDQNDLVLHYQPKVNMQSGQVMGLEALIRWQDPERGLIYPDKFLPAINFNEPLMLKLSDWVFNRVLAQLSEWNQTGFDLAISINISAHEIHKLDIKTYLTHLLENYQNVRPNQLELEILETHAIEDSTIVKDMIKECQDLGLQVSLDDFGTGYSTLSYLKSLPINTLKIDRSFVKDMLIDQASLSIIEASMGLAKAFNCKTVAEGVESAEQGIILQQLGCQVAQGYAITQPIPAEEVIDWLTNWKGIEAWSQHKQIDQNENN